MNTRRGAGKGQSINQIFEILNFIEDEDYDQQIMVKVQRLSDQKEFILELDYLKAVDKKSKNYQLLDDYSVWHVNY